MIRYGKRINKWGVFHHVHPLKTALALRLPGNKSQAGWRSLFVFFSKYQKDIQGGPKKPVISIWWFKATFLGWLSDPFKGLTDLQPGDEKVTLNHLVGANKWIYKVIIIVTHGHLLPAIFEEFQLHL